MKHALFSLIIALLLIVIAVYASQFKVIWVNTLTYWMLIAFSLGAAIFVLSPLNIKTHRLAYIIAMALAIFIIIYALLEKMYFYGNTNIWNEEERVDSTYRWFDVYLDESGKDKTADLTEGYFANNWNLTAEEALKQKYDKFYEILALQPGMKVIDIGCGYGHWMAYLKTRGVTSVGVTLSQAQVEEGKRRELDIRLQDGRNLPNTYHGQFDAVTFLGSSEHFAKCYYTDKHRKQIYNAFMANCKRAIKPDSKSGRILSTALNVDNDKWSTTDYLKAYILERFYSGRYPVVGELNEAASKNGMQRVYYSDQTEDYRYISIINPEHFGNFEVKKWTVERILYIPFMFLTDPFATHKWLYHDFKIWMWHLGGTSKIPDPTRYSPCRLKWEAWKAWEASKASKADNSWQNGS